MPYCPNCGREVQAGEKFCSYCGQRLSLGTEGEQYRSTEQYEQPKDQFADLGQDQEGRYATGRPPYAFYTPPKSPGVAALLALLLGFFGLFGIGHIYVGKIVKGIVLLVIGIVAMPLFVLSSFFGFSFLGDSGIRAWIILAIIAGIAWLVIWIWQTFDAYRLANEYNAHVQRTGLPPW